jgi:cysteine dioxygenase
MNLKDITKELENNPNIQKIKLILNNYNSDDYKEYINFDENNYKRTIIHTCDDFDIILICWKQGQYTKIHDHPNYCCMVKLLEGKLLEENFTINYDKLKVYNNVIIKPGDITMKCSNIIVHRIVPLEDSVSIHIYMPGKYKSNYYE